MSNLDVQKEEQLWPCHLTLSLTTEDWTAPERRKSSIYHFFIHVNYEREVSMTIVAMERSAYI